MNNEFYKYSRLYLNEHPENRDEIVSEHVRRLEFGKEVWNNWAERFCSMWGITSL